MNIQLELKSYLRFCFIYACCTRCFEKKAFNRSQCVKHVTTQMNAIEQYFPQVICGSDILLYRTPRINPLESINTVTFDSVGENESN